MTSKDKYIHWLNTKTRPIKSIPNYIRGIINVETALGLELNYLFDEIDIEIIQNIFLQYENSPGWQKDYSSHLKLLLQYKKQLPITKNFSNKQLANEQEQDEIITYFIDVNKMNALA